MSIKKNNSILTVEDIKKGIRSFSKSDDYQYSIFINGEWGIGKTFFIKEIIRDCLDDSVKLKTIYISLFGISTIHELNEKISAEILLKTLDVKKFKETRNGKIATMLGKTAINVLLKKMALSSEDFPEISEWAEFIPQKDKQKFIFVFDDIERTSCEIKDILGYINSFVEQYKAKVIIIGYQDMIGFTGDIKESKEKNALSYLHDEEVEDQKKISVVKGLNKSKQDLEQEVFSQYEEKLIGYKIYFKPDFNEVAKSFITNLVDTQQLEKINISFVEIFQLLTSIFYYVGENNLRILQNVVCTISQLCKCIINPDNESLFIKPEFKKEFLIISITKIAFLKLGKNPPQSWLDTNLNCSILFQNSSFHFVETFVESSIMPQLEFKEDIQNFIEKRQWVEENKEDPLQILRDKFHILESYKKLTELYNQLINNIDLSKYTPNNFAEILVLVSKLEVNGLIENGEFSSVISKIEQVVKSIEWNLPEYKNFYFETSYFISTEGMLDSHLETFKNKFSEWNNLKENYLTKSLASELKNNFERNDMVGLKSCILENKNQLKLNKQLLSFVDCSIIKYFLEKASSKLYQEFRAAVYVIYNEIEIDNKDEKTTINDIINWCNSNTDNNEDKIVLMQRRWLRDNFKKLI